MRSEEPSSRHRGLQFRGEVALQAGDLQAARMALQAARDGSAAGGDPHVRMVADLLLLEIERRLGESQMPALLGRADALLEESQRLGCRRAQQRIAEWLGQQVG